ILNDRGSVWSLDGIFHGVASPPPWRYICRHVRCGRPDVVTSEDEQSHCEGPADESVLILGVALLVGGGAMARKEEAQEAQVSEAQIAVHWPEEPYYYPPAKFIAQGNAADPAIFDRFSEEHFPECFKEYADLQIGR